jgi:TorA specific chaperone
VSAALARAALSPDFGWNASIAEWLAGLFIAAPCLDTVIGYREGMGAAFLEAVAEEPGCAAGVQQMQSALIVQDPPVVIARKLTNAFTQLFVGVGGSKTVSLYESAHVSVSGRLFQKPAGDMGQLLRLSNVSTGDAFREPPDHLSIELALLARLIRHDTDPKAQAALLDNHLLMWVPMFADQCRDRDRTGYYAGAACVLTAFLTAQRATLQVTRP